VLTAIREKILAEPSFATNDTLWRIAQFKAADPALIDIIRRAHRDMSPSLLDALPFFLMHGQDVQPTKEDFLAGKFPMERMFMMLSHCDGQSDELTVKPFGLMLTLFAAKCESGGVPVVWSQSLLRDAFWAVCRILSSSGGDPDGAPAIDGAGILGTTIVETYLPIVHDLSIEDILNFRSKHG
jgi:hypothetical protein